MQLTGQLGEVMQESAQAAFSYAKARADEIGINEEDFENFDIHVHIPEGAIPKDGPSAGITMATAMVSVAFAPRDSQRHRNDGRDNFKRQRPSGRRSQRKSFAARRAKIKTVILPAPNERDLEDLPQEVLNDLTFIFVENVQEVFREALRRNPKTIEKTKKSAAKK